MNLLHRKIESDGVLNAARRLGITLIAYSPLAGYMLTGKSHDDWSLVTKMLPARRTDLRTSNSTARLPWLRAFATLPTLTAQSSVKWRWLGSSQTTARRSSPFRGRQNLTTLWKQQQCEWN